MPVRRESMVSLEIHLTFGSVLIGFPGITKSCGGIRSGSTCATRQWATHLCLSRSEAEAACFIRVWNWHSEYEKLLPQWRKGAKRICWLDALCVFAPLREYRDHHCGACFISPDDSAGATTERISLQRQSLPPHKLHSVRHRHSRLPEDHG